jgi:uncharacterized membrane protein YgdD (TMEM256/DUF423 family)
MAAMWRRLAGVSGCSSVAMAAYGAHGLPDLSPQLKLTMENGVRLHMVHSAVLAICPLLPRPHLSGALFFGGIVGFSGSCYAAVLTNERRNGRFAPVGGTMLMLGWLSLVL